ncbi:hypothetical protein CR513_47578, partial [Mucuna pruriens]
MTKYNVVILGPKKLPNLVGRLDDHNYLQWAQYICTTLKMCKKLSHIEGYDSPRDNPKFEAWDDEDSFIMTWLWNSMTLKISRNYMFYSSIHEIWENLIETCSMKKDFTTCHDIESKIFNFRQEPLLVTEYYGTLNGLWIKLDQYQGLKMQGEVPLSLKELTTRRKIGVAKEQGGLYYLQHTKIDNGTEFVNLEFSKFHKDNCVVHKVKCVNTPQQNGVAERKNHLLEVARVLLFQMMFNFKKVTKLTLVPQQVQLSKPKSFIVVIDVIKIPTSLYEVLKDENWVQAIKEEMKTLEKNLT